MPNRMYVKGRNWEYDIMYYYLFHRFRVIRSYASKTECDLYLFPPKNSKIDIGLGIQAKDLKGGKSYLVPKEREQLKKFSDSYKCMTIEVFKRDRRAIVKLTPWNLKGKEMEIEDFLKIYYGVKDAYSWKDWRRMWFREGIKRKP